MPPAGFKFIDLPDAAQRLGITRLKMLEWVGEGKIRPFSGSGQQSVFRSADVDRLAQELGIPLPGSMPAATDSPQQTTLPDQGQDALAGPPGAARPRRRDPIKLIGTRLSMDSRWAEISNEDIATWLDAIEPVQYDRVLKVANLTIERLQRVMAMIDEAKRHA